jgi:hypothetical protein
MLHSSSCCADRIANTICLLPCMYSAVRCSTVSYLATLWPSTLSALTWLKVVYRSLPRNAVAIHVTIYLWCVTIPGYKIVIGDFEASFSSCGTAQTKRVHSNGNTCDLYAGGALIESWPGLQLFWLRFLCGFLQSLQATGRIVPGMDYNHFLPHPFHFISYPTIWCYVAWVTESVVK